MRSVLDVIGGDVTHYHQVKIAARAQEKVLSDYVILKDTSSHPKQDGFVTCAAKRIICRAGRRSGKTTGVAARAVKRFLAGARILYATPTADQFERFWFEVKMAFAEAIAAGIVHKNETKHYIEVPNTRNRIKAKTAWNADTLRGDDADELLLDEFQLMSEDTWSVVGAPMLLDNNGNATFLYTPPSIRSVGRTKAKDPQHASKLFKSAAAEMLAASAEGRQPRWATFAFSSHDNPYLSTEALAEITKDMSRAAYQQEILAIDREDNPFALWSRELLKAMEWTDRMPDLYRVVVAVDPSASSGGDEAGIVVGGIGYCHCQGEAAVHGFLLDDGSLQASPSVWAAQSVALYNKHKADRMVAEKNNGGEMVSTTIGTIKGAPPVTLIHASRGKATRAEPVVALCEQGKIHHVGRFDLLEDELCGWAPGQDSPNRLDAYVWAFTELMVGQEHKWQWG